MKTAVFVETYEPTMGSDKRQTLLVPHNDEVKIYTRVTDGQQGPANKWIEVDKALSDQYTFDVAYIDHLIDRIDRGEYDPDLLSDAEREQIEIRLTNKG